MNVMFLTLAKFESIKDQGIYTDLIREFSNNGHQMYIIQPLEKRYKKNTHQNIFDKINILNVKIGNITKTNIIEKGISTITLHYKIKKAIKKHYKDIRFDLVLYATPPVTLTNVISYIKKKFNSVSYLMLKDIFPQNAIDLGILRKKNPVYWYFRYKEKKLYYLSDYIGCMSEANAVYIKKNNFNLDESKIEILPNSISPLNIKLKMEEYVNIRGEFNLPLDKTIFIYGGNLGKPQGIDFIISCLEKNEQNSKSFILIVGSGTEYQKLKRYFDQNSLSNSKLIGNLNKEKYEALVHACDVGLIFLDRRFTIPNFPSRILSYMQASLPILASTDIISDIGEVIEENKFGYWCESINPENFNLFLNKLCNKKTRIKLGMNARAYLEANYTSKISYDIIMKHFKK